MARIHPTARIDPGAELGDDVEVAAYALIGAHVRIGEGSRIGPHCVVEGHTTIGRNNRFAQASSIGPLSLVAMASSKCAKLTSAAGPTWMMPAT